MADPEHESSAPPELEDGYSVVVQGLGRRHASSRSAYAAPTTIWSRFLGGGGSSGSGDGDDDEDDEDEVAPPTPLAQDRLERWALRDVSFSLRPGEALAVVGGTGSGAEVLMRVLSTMLPPSAGRATLVGRVGPTSELATALTRIDASPRYHSRLLAGAAHVPRSDRASWIEDLFAFARVDEAGRAARADPEMIFRRLTVAAMVDPTADVLLIDDLPALGDPTFRARCLERLRLALDRGATAIVAGPEATPMLEFCREAILMTEGRIARRGTPAELIEEHRRRSRENPVEQTRARGQSLPGFNEYAAILDVKGIEDRGGEPGSALVQVEVESAFHNTEIAVSLLLSPVEAVAEDPVVVKQAPYARCPDPGRYLVTATLDSEAGAVVPARLEIVVSVRSRGLETEIGRRSSARLWTEPPHPALEDASQFPATADAIRPFTDIQATWQIDWLEEPD
jgi:ABC-2 type transport system ATP-binding protein